MTAPVPLLPSHIFPSCPFADVLPVRTFLATLHIPCQTQLQGGFGLHVWIVVIFCLAFLFVSVDDSKGEEAWEEIK